MIGFGLIFLVIRLLVDRSLTCIENCGCCRGRAWKRAQREREAAAKAAILANEDGDGDDPLMKHLEDDDDDYAAKDDGPGADQTWIQKWDDASGKYLYHNEETGM